jgi:hypothetical protein
LIIRFLKEFFKIFIIFLIIQIILTFFNAEPSSKWNPILFLKDKMMPGFAFSFAISVFRMMRKPAQ